MKPHAARPVAMHDTTELDRHMRGARRALALVAASGLITLGYALTHVAAVLS